MGGENGNGSRGPRASTSRGRTLAGSPRPAPGSGEKRITLEFEGARLRLPGEKDPSSPPALTLDTAELHVPDAGTGPDPTGAPAPIDELFGSSRPALLDLELAELDAEAAERADDRDGWSRARETPSSYPPRQRASTPPPMPRVARTLDLRDEGDDALSLVSARARKASTPALDLVAEMHDRFALGDFSGALRAAELILGREAGHAEALECAEASRERLTAFYVARLGSLVEPPRVAVPEKEIRWLGLDHRAGFVLSRIDGVTTIEEIVDMTGMPRLEVLKTLVELVGAGVVAIGPRTA